MEFDKMINVAVTLAANSLALNGAALYVNRFAQNASGYKKNGINIEICDCHRMFNDPKIYVKTKTFSRKQTLKKILGKSYFGNCVLLYWGMVKHAKEAILEHKEYIENADMVIANDVQTAYFSKKYFPKKPLLFIMHNSGDLYRMDFIQFPKIQKGPAKLWLERIARFVFEHADKIIFVSETARQYFISQHPEAESKTYFMPQCIEDADYVVDKDFTSLNLVCVGTVGHRKNQFSILDALVRLREDSDFQKKYGATKITLSLVGDGDELQRCKDYVRENNLTNVYFHGAQDDVPKYLNVANCFIFPSLDEGLPTVAIEAMRAGLPLIISDVGGCRELIDGNGILLKNGTVDEVVRGIKFMLERKSDMSGMAKKSRKMYEDSYTIDNMINRYSELVRKLAERNF